MLLFQAAHVAGFLADTRKRHDKAEKKLPLNAPVKKLTVYAESEQQAKSICSAMSDIAGTLKAANTEVIAGTRTEGRQVSAHNVYVKVEY